MNLCKPPEPLKLSGNLALNWKNFQEELKWYLAGTECDGKADSVKIGILLSHAGREAREVFETFSWEEEGHKTNYSKVTDAFFKFCNPRKNLLFERYQFWQIEQEDDEGIDSYLTRLKAQVVKCEYKKDSEMEMVRDKFVFGLRDEGLIGKMLRESDQELDKIIQIAQASEVTKQQIKQMTAKERVNAIRTITCGQCGDKHAPKSCPAYGKTCSACQRLHHYAKMCRNKKSKTEYSKKPYIRKSNNKAAHELQEESCGEEEDEDVLHVKSLAVDAMSEDAWFETIDCAGIKVEFKLDTGAQANVIPLRVYSRLKDKIKLKKTKSKLTAFGGHDLVPLGVCMIPSSFRGHEENLKFYVTNADTQAILGLKALDRMNMVKRVDLLSKKETIIEQYQDVFTGLGTLGDYKIQLKTDATPVIHPPRRVPHSLMPKLKETLDSSCAEGVISKVDEPTDWVNSLVIVEKKNGTLRLCLDPKDLNQAIKREHYMIPTAEDVSSKLANKKLFTILDLKDGYWQVRLDEESSRLCTFNTPFGRYKFNRMPFGISSASEVFQKKNEEAFLGISGVHAVADDLIIAATTREEHDQILQAVLERAREKNIKFNRDKIQLRVPEVKYVGNIVSASGLRPDPAKVQAIVNMPPPSDKAGIKRFLGTVNYLGQFIEALSTKSAPLRELLKEDVEFSWDKPQDEAMKSLKQALIEAPVLHFYDPKKQSTIQADASQNGLGACLMQDNHPIAYASRSLTDAERNYAQIEKELLAIVFACEKFHQYIYGFQTDVQSDHKPLETITKKPLSKAAPRLQRMLLRLQKYDLTVKYVPGKYMSIADTLSRAYEETEKGEEISQEELEATVHTLIVNLPMSAERRESMVEATAEDPTLSKVLRFVKTGWPEHKYGLSHDIAKLWSFRDEMQEAEGLLFVGDRVIIPASQRKVSLEAIHEGHMGIEKCKARARVCMYWPGMGSDIERYINKCAVCNKYANSNVKEPLISHEIPSRPWAKVATDFFQWCGKDYILVVDYFSKYPEAMQVESKTAETAITYLKSVFARHGIPETVIADNMPFNSKAVKQFAKEWGFEIITSSPTYAQSNGLAERYVGIIKKMLQKAREDQRDPYLALLELRNSPITGMDYSPAQMLMGRRIRSKLPMKSTLLEPETVRPHDRLIQRQKKQKEFYDRTAKVRKTIQPESVVRYKCKQGWAPAVVTKKLAQPRSYLIETPEGTILRRNTRHLRVTGESAPKPAPPDYVTQPLPDPISVAINDTPETMNGSDNSVNEAQPTVKDSPRSNSITTPHVTRSGRIVRLPARYRDCEM
jgi:transposase InsO family protein